MPEWFDLFVGLEAAAARMAEYEHSVVPGLFQLYLDKPTETERFDAAFGTIWKSALDEQSSRDLITRTAEDMRNG